MTLPINYLSRMKNLVRFSVLLVLLISFAGCESEPVTDIAKIEKELKSRSKRQWNYKVFGSGAGQ